MELFPKLQTQLPFYWDSDRLWAIQCERLLKHSSSGTCANRQHPTQQFKQLVEMKEVKLNSVRVNSNTQAHEDANARMQRKDSDSPNECSEQTKHVVIFLFPSGEPESGRFYRSVAHRTWWSWIVELLNHQPRSSFLFDPYRAALGCIAPLGVYVLPTSWWLLFCCFEATY